VLNLRRSAIAALVRSPWQYCPFRLPGGPPLPLAPPCNRHRPFFVAGDRQGNDFLGARKLVGREPVTLVNKERYVVVPGGEGRGRSLVNWTPSGAGSSNALAEKLKRLAPTKRNDRIVSRHMQLTPKYLSHSQRVLRQE
jgi:hypothetical protein